MYIISNLIFILVGVALVIGYYREREIIEFEDRVIEKIKTRIGGNGIERKS